VILFYVHTLLFSPNILHNLLVFNLLLEKPNKIIRNHTLTQDQKSEGNTLEYSLIRNLTPSVRKTQYLHIFGLEGLKNTHEDWWMQLILDSVAKSSNSMHAMAIGKGISLTDTPTLPF